MTTRRMLGIILAAAALAAPNCPQQRPPLGPDGYEICTCQWADSGDEMAFNAARDGDLVEQQSGLTEADAAWADELQRQMAAGFEMQWLNVPLRAGQPETTNPSYIAWSDQLGPINTAKGWTLTSHATATIRLGIAIPGHSLWRRRAEIYKIRVYVGGGFTIGAGSSGGVIVRYDVDYSDPATTPPAATSVATAGWAGNGPGAGSFAVNTADLSSAPVALSENYNYYLEAYRQPGGSGTMELYGVQLLMRYPLTPN